MQPTQTIYGGSPYTNDEHRHGIYTLFDGLVQFRVSLVPMVYSVINKFGTTMFDWWSLRTKVISSVDHSGLDPVGPPLMDGVGNNSKWYEVVSRHRCFTTCPSRPCQPYWEMVKILNRPCKEELQIKYILMHDTSS